MFKTHARAALAAGCMIAFSSGAFALTNPYTENFITDNASWTNNANGPADFIAAGGPDGSSYITGAFNFAGTNGGSTPAILRCQSTTSASGGAFFGDWIAGGVTQLTYKFRHDSTALLSPFVRFAPTAGFPGLAAVAAPIAGGQWQTVTFTIDAGATYFPEPGATFANVFSDVKRMQFGVLPGQLAGVNTTVHFDIDIVSITPAPGAAAAFAPLGLIALRRRR